MASSFCVGPRFAYPKRCLHLSLYSERLLLMNRHIQRVAKFPEIVQSAPADFRAGVLRIPLPIFPIYPVLFLVHFQIRATLNPASPSRRDSIDIRLMCFQKSLGHLVISFRFRGKTDQHREHAGASCRDCRCNPSGCWQVVVCI